MLLITDYGSHGKLSAGPVQALCAKNIRGGEKKAPSLSVHACGAATVF